jgi:hypothetical protein
MITPNMANIDPSTRYKVSPLLDKAMKDLTIFIPSQQKYTAYDIATAVAMYINRSNGWIQRSAKYTMYSLRNTPLRDVFGVDRIHPEKLLTRLHMNVEPLRDTQAKIPHFKITQIMREHNQPTVTRITFDPTDSIKSMKRVSSCISHSTEGAPRRKAGRPSSKEASASIAAKKATINPRKRALHSQKSRRTRSNTRTNVCLACNNTIWLVRDDLEPTKTECTRCHAIQST